MDVGCVDLCGLEWRNDSRYRVNCYHSALASMPEPLGHKIPLIKETALYLLAF